MVARGGRPSRGLPRSVVLSPLSAFEPTTSAGFIARSPAVRSCLSPAIWAAKTPRLSSSIAASRDWVLSESAVYLRPAAVASTASGASPCWGVRPSLRVPDGAQTDRAAYCFTMKLTSVETAIFGLVASTPVTVKV